jgi:hypothetical protein
VIEEPACIEDAPIGVASMREGAVASGRRASWVADIPIEVDSACVGVSVEAVEAVRVGNVSLSGPSMGGSGLERAGAVPVGVASAGGEAGTTIGTGARTACAGSLPADVGFAFEGSERGTTEVSAGSGSISADEASLLKRFDIFLRNFSFQLEVEENMVENNRKGSYKDLCCYRGFDSWWVISSEWKRRQGDKVLLLGMRWLSVGRLQRGPSRTVVAFSWLSLLL